NRQRIFSYSLLTVVLLLVLLAVVIYRNYRNNKKFSAILSRQKEEILLKNDELVNKNTMIEAQANELENANRELEIQRDEVTEKNKAITDSIQYAKRIQAAMLPQREVLEPELQDYFIIFRPRDIVSGDFYWATTVTTTNIVGAKDLSPLPILVVAVADCTGHGVPGAFMSMLGIALFNEIVSRTEEPNAGLVLDRLRENVIDSLHQRGRLGEAKDGMDVGLCILDIQSGKMQYAGANSPLYVIKNTVNSVDTHGRVYLHYNDNKTNNPDSPLQLTEIKPDKMPIGIHERMESFKNHEVEINKGDCLYLFSDGFVDQFGGPYGKKFMSLPFKKLIESVSDLPMNEQKNILNRTFDEWKAVPDHDGDTYDQVDDVTVLGMRI
ncbi:MAG: SpoIIE family protein phosphatase, partial [Bacteroidetes bacterium]|nr:SpoIIE family protein phosphatase [Bacteroidota bacterium]